MGVQFSYNGYNFYYVQTKEFRIDDATEPSGVDMMHQEITLTVRAVITPSDFGGGSLQPAQSNESPAETFARIKQGLMTPRGALTYSLNDKSLINISAANGNPPPDPMDGPTPLYCKPVMEHYGYGATAGNPAWIIEFSIKCAVIGCANGANRPFKTLRWSQSLDLDEKGYSILRTTGRATINPFALRNVPNATPDNFREDLAPPLIDRFIRKAEYTIAESGLEFAFIFTDTEVLYNPPFTQNNFQLAKFSGRADLAFNRGGIAVGTVSIELIGQKDTPKADMVRLGMLILFDKLQQFDPTRGAGGRYSPTLKIEEDLNKDSVRLSSNVIAINAGKRNAQGFLQTDPDLVANKFGTPTSAIGKTQLNVGSRGSAQLMLIGPALGDPCAVKLAFPSSSVKQNQALIQLPSISFVPALPSPPQLSLSSGWDQVPGVFDVVHIEATYDEDSGRVPLAVTGASPGTGNNVVVVQLNDRVMTKTFAWRSEKTGSSPVVPSFASDIPEMVPLTRRVQPEMVDVMPDGSLKYIISGVYTYAFTNTSLATCAYPMPPWLGFAGGLSLTDLPAFFNGEVSLGSIDIAADGDGSPFSPYT
jgi:hypothetical protein